MATRLYINAINQSAETVLCDDIRDYISCLKAHSLGECSDLSDEDTNRMLVLIKRYLELSLADKKIPILHPLAFGNKEDGCWENGFSPSVLLEEYGKTTRVVGEMLELASKKLCKDSLQRLINNCVELPADKHEKSRIRLVYQDDYSRGAFIRRTMTVVIEVNS